MIELIWNLYINWKEERQEYKAYRATHVHHPDYNPSLSMKYSKRRQDRLIHDIEKSGAGTRRTDYVI